MDEYNFKNDFKRGRVDDAIRRKKMRRRLWGVIVLVVIGFGIYGAVRYEQWYAASTPGVLYPNQGQKHVELNAPLSMPYNSNPPSSGDHYVDPANWGIYNYEAPDRIFIHNLEHGGIWIAYKPGIPAEAIADLTTIVNEFGKSKLVMTPRSANDADIAIVAWMHVFKFNLSGEHLTDQQKKDIKIFYGRLKNHSPENVPDSMPGIEPREAK